MPPRSNANNKSSLKRDRASQGQDAQDQKKPRRSGRLSSQTESKTTTPVNHDYLPTPLTERDSTITDHPNHESTATPPSKARTSPKPEPPQGSRSTPLESTQPLSQFVYPPGAFAEEVHDEEGEGVWGYLLPLDSKIERGLVLKKRDGCQRPRSASKAKSDGDKGPGKSSEDGNNDGLPGGYLVGRHPECDLILALPTISNRHFLLFSEKKKGDVVAMLEDLSSNGTFVNDAIVGRNKHRALEDGDEISILNEARFCFRYPQTKVTNSFRQQYKILQALGEGHFAAVYLCVDRASGQQYAVKWFRRRSGESQKAQTDSLQQEIALLMSINHPSLLCLKETFDENDGVYLVTELAREGELFNLIVSKQKLSEDETRHIFRQLFEGLKYLHDRGIVHRDIKPENVLVADKNLNVKLADFGLSKIIGEDSFTTTMCGTPSYAAPEVLVSDDHYRKYTKAIDIWSLGVVLYICLCGFPPFSNELYSARNPYKLADQIKLGRFDYPSPYWDSVADSALDLIDRMLTVDVNDRITVDGCLAHSWLVGQSTSLTDSTDGLTGALGKLDFSKRKVHRQRTLLSSINDVQYTERDEGGAPVKVFHRNEAGRRVLNRPSRAVIHQQEREAGPGAASTPEDFANFGERGDPVIFGEE